MATRITAAPVAGDVPRPRIVLPTAAGLAGDPLLLTVVWSYLLATLVVEVTGLVVMLPLGSFDLNVLDVPFFVSLAVAGVALATRAKHVSWAIVLGGLVGVLLVINLLRGITVDIGASLIWLRSNGFFIIALVMAATARTDPVVERQVRRAFAAVGLLLSLLVVLRLVFGPSLFGIAPEMALANEYRPISVHGAMLMNAAAVLLLSHAVRRRWVVPGSRLAALAVILLTVVLTGQGTATLCLIAGVAALMLFENGPNITPRLIGIGAVVVAALIVALIPTELYVSDDARQLLAARGRNREFRQFIWQGYQNYLDGQDIWTQVLGSPANSQPTFTIYPPGAEQVWSKSLHSMYFGQIAVSGYLGLMIYVVMLALLLGAFAFAMMRRVQPTIFSAAAGLALLLQTMLLGYSYEVRNEELLALLIAWTIARTLPTAGLRRSFVRARPSPPAAPERPPRR